MADYTINSLTAPDNYTSASTIENVPLAKVTVDVFNQQIYWQAKTAVGNGQAGVWENVEHAMAPGSRSIQRAGLVGVRFRAFTAKAALPSGFTQAVFTATAVPSL